MQPELIKLQELNGLNVGNMLHSDKACRNMLTFIGEKMSAQLADFIVKSSDQLSILIDESSTVSNKTCLIVYTGEAICDTLIQSLNEQGITEDILQYRLLGFAMMGKYRGTAMLLRECTNEDLVIIHCMNHTLELAVHDAVNEVTSASHFQIFNDSLYVFFSQSPKHMRELESVAAELGMRTRRVDRVFDIHWLSLSCTSVMSLWESYPALPSDAHQTKAQDFRSRFFRALAENIERRLVDKNGVLSTAAVLNPKTWPADKEPRVLYGDEKVLQLRKDLHIDVCPVLLLKDFRQYKFTACIGEHLQKVITTVSSIPVSTAECERGFSAMNLILTDERNRMLVSTLNTLLFIAVNGPEVVQFPAQKYTIMWVKEGRHSADDAATRKKLEKGTEDFYYETYT
ncbi:hypothetical protein SKAU_G00211990 [Synaphobranchus kaupii]|uniref:HAT C-terminal dimerisation domain-containing protein n=1 Tax=Synaphobranchus kaupii TaxID=118154 RepID=A0A9Q1F9A6_SYNKA|nr:hypothetical protein SKAU_G00211990 [Synaphobranchus kaupii]